MTNKQTLGLILLACLISIAMIFFSVQMASGSTFPKASDLPAIHASTTAYALSAGTAKQLLATSTRAEATGTFPATVGRSSFSLQPVNCATGDVWLQFNDVAPALSTGYFVQASSTKTAGEDFPMVYGSVRAVSNGANCTVLVTEFRSQY